jgi:DNA-binding NarL/FixJ family response regulator
VAIVDDEPDIHLAIKFILGPADEFEFAGSFLTGVEALQGILANPPDLVLMDIRLPDVSGIECTRRLATALPRLRIVMISALDDRQTVADALQAGCHSYVTKPFVAPQFLALLRCALASVANGASRISDGTYTCPLHRGPGATGCVTIREREAKVLNALGKGRYYKEIADEFNLSQAMVNKLIHHAFRKLGVNNRHQAVAQWIVCSHCPQLIIRTTSRTGRRKETRKSSRKKSPRR